MTVKRKLLLSTLVAALLVGLVSNFLIFSSHQVTLAAGDAARATSIVDAISQVRFLTFENLLHHDQRSLEQWQTKNQEVPALLKPVARSDAAERTALHDIRQLWQESGALFDRLVASYDSPGVDQKELQERLATQLLVKQQTQITEALQLAALAQSRVTTINQRANMLVGAVAVFMLSITALNFFFITRTITRSLRALQKGAEAIATGRFGYRIKPRNRNDEFGRVAAAFNTMAAGAGQIDREKTEFILLASHQLRTPLTAVKWYAKALAQPSKDMTAERQKQYADQIYVSNERMITLVNKLLEAAQAAQDNLTPRPEEVRIDMVVVQVLEDAAVQLRDNQITLVTQLGKKLPVVTVDPSWLRVILHNLLSNAIRYSRPGQQVTLAVKRTGKSVVMSVVDSGYGIPARQRDKIFTKLFRADNAKQVIGEGSGLDLYITKTMVDRAGGKIWFTSVENKGTTFYVELPIGGQAKGRGKS